MTLQHFGWCGWGAKRRVRRVQTQEQGPTLVQEEVPNKNIHFTDTNILVFVGYDRNQTQNRNSGSYELEPDI